MNRRPEGPALIWPDRAIERDIWAGIEPVLAAHPDCAVRRRGNRASTLLGVKRMADDTGARSTR